MTSSQKALLRSVDPARAREGSGLQRTRVIREAQREIDRRMAFDEKHPGIYKNPRNSNKLRSGLQPRDRVEQYKQSGLRPVQSPRVIVVA